jgi:hypothetical protein
LQGYFAFDQSFGGGVFIAASLTPSLESALVSVSDLNQVDGPADEGQAGLQPVLLQELGQVAGSNPQDNDDHSLGDQPDSGSGDPIEDSDLPDLDLVFIDPEFPSLLEVF